MFASIEERKGEKRQAEIQVERRQREKSS